MRCDPGLIVVETAMGWIGTAVSEQGIYRVVLPRKEKRSVEKEIRQETAEISLGSNNKITNQAVKLIRKYFSGERVLFDLPLDMRYYTRFQKAVWQATTEIPYGETRSYAWVAERIGNPRAVRAVGRALGANPVPIIIPCHRVIGSSGKLCGFAGGLALKQKLLELENTNGGNGAKEILRFSGVTKELNSTQNGKNISRKGAKRAKNSKI